MRETKTAKKLAAVLMLVSFIFATVSPAMAAGLANITDIAGGKGGTTGDAGTIYFGSYWQSFADGYSSSSTEYSNPDAFNEFERLQQRGHKMARAVKRPDRHRNKTGIPYVRPGAVRRPV